MGVTPGPFRGNRFPTIARCPEDYPVLPHSRHPILHHHNSQRGSLCLQSRNPQLVALWTEPPTCWKPTRPPATDPLLVSLPRSSQGPVSQDSPQSEHLALYTDCSILDLNSEGDLTQPGTLSLPPDLLQTEHSLQRLSLSNQARLHSQSPPPSYGLAVWTSRVHCFSRCVSVCQCGAATHSQSTVQPGGCQVIQTRPEKSLNDTPQPKQTLSPLPQVRTQGTPFIQTPWPGQQLLLPLVKGLSKAEQLSARHSAQLEGSRQIFSWPQTSLRVSHVDPF